MNETPGIDRELGRLKKQLGETASGNVRQRDAINSRMDMLRERTGYQTEEKKATPDRLAELERKIDTLQRSISSGKFVSELILARKGATVAQFNELTVPDSGTTLTPVVSGGRNVTIDTDPMSPLDLGIDDSVLMEVLTQNTVKTVRIAGGGVKKVRYIQTPIHAFQQTYKVNPLVDADWETIVELDPCTTSAARTGNLFNPLGLVNNRFLYEESVTVNLGAPITNTVQITTADTTTTGTGSTEILTESLAFSLFRINAYAIGTTPKTHIRIFVSYDGGTTKFWIGHIDVEQNDATGIAPRFAGRWTPADDLNGMVMPDTASIWVSTYDTATFNVTIEGSRVA